MAENRKELIGKNLYNSLIHMCEEGDKEARNLLLNAVVNNTQLTSAECLLEQLNIYGLYLFHYSNNFSLSGNVASVSLTMSEVENTIRFVGEIFKTLGVTEISVGFCEASDADEESKAMLYQYKDAVSFLLKNLLVLEAINSAQYRALYLKHSVQVPNPWEVMCVTKEVYETVYNSGIEALCKYVLPYATVVVRR